MMRHILAIVIILGLNGCATTRLYDGDRLPSNKIALLERGDLGQILVDVDTNKSINFFLTNNKIELLPGMHHIWVGYGDGKNTGPYKSLVFTAESGATYTIKSAFHNDRWSPSIINTTTGKNVSSLPINLIPMYGAPHIVKSKGQERTDNEFIQHVVSGSGSRESAAKEFVSIGWGGAVKRQY